MSSLIESIDAAPEAEGSISKMLERVSGLLEVDRASVHTESGGREHSTRLPAGQGAPAGDGPDPGRARDAAPDVVRTAAFEPGPRCRAAIEAGRAHVEDDLRALGDPDPTERRLLAAGILSTL
jgi:hypothetical protein